MSFRRSIDRSEGFSLVSAIFLLVVISVAAASMLSLAGAARRPASLELLSLRAYEAAASGIEWGIAKAVADPSICPAATFGLNEGSLVGFSVDVGCTRTQHVEVATTVNVFQITALATYGVLGDADHVTRRMTATATVDN